ncbi:MAG: hypothetical protein GXZ12_07620 [Clostridiaceae bacterium]|nr:hypothetical protein [Clostridiaceae bacterium]
MKKFTKVAALVLAFSLAGFAIAGCKAVKENKDSDTSETEITEETETTEVSEESESTVEAQQESDSVELSEEEVYQLFMEFIDEYNANHADSMYCFIENCNSDYETIWSLLITSSDQSISEEYTVANGEVTLVGDSIRDHTFYTYDTIRQFPVLLCSSPSPFEFECIELIPSIEDGLYYGSINAFSLDGTEMFVYLGDPIIISAEEHDAFLAGDQISVNDGYEISLSSLPESGLSFMPQDDGSYILTSANDMIVTVNSRLMIIDVAPDCVICDHFQFFLNGGFEEGYDYTQLPNSDGDNNLSNTFFYENYTSDSFENINYPNYSTWTPAYGILEPVVIENNQIVSMTLGWR